MFKAATSGFEHFSTIRAILLKIKRNCNRHFCRIYGNSVSYGPPVVGPRVVSFKNVVPQGQVKQKGQGQGFF